MVEDQSKQQLPHPTMMDLKEAEGIIKGLAGLFEANPSAQQLADGLFHGRADNLPLQDGLPNLDARYRTFVEQMPAVVFIAFLDRGISEAYVSPHIESVLGFSQKEWLDDPIRWYRQIHPEDKGRWSLEAAQMLISGDPLRSVYRVLARDGRVVWFQCDVKMVRDERGRPWFLHGLGVDITELRETQAEATRRAHQLEAANLNLKVQIAEREAVEKSLRESEEKFRLLVEGVKDYAIFMLDRDGYIMSWNRGAERLKGYSADEIIGKHFSKFYSKEDIQKDLPAEALRIAQSAGRYEAEGWRLRKDGSKFWANVLITALVERGGRLYGFSKLTRDMTEQKLIQDKLQESERLAAMGTTAAVFAHEIGNPLNAISTSLQLLQHQLATKDHDSWINENLQTVLQEIYRLGSLLDDFRSLARPHQLDLAPTNLPQLVSEFMGSHAAYYLEREIVVEQDFPRNLPMALADSRRLKQALLNLCKNAVEAMPGGGTLTIRGRHRVGLVSLEITDSGAGIPDDFEIFQLFKTTKDNGTGLGLAIVRQIISAQGGTISYQSEVGKGTTFTISLPMA
jgi:PAS domain S-box-containing protein